MRMEVEKIKEELREREERWNKEREEVKGRIEKLERELEEWKWERKEGKEKRKGTSEKEGGGFKGGVKGGEGDMKERVEGILKELGVGVEGKIDEVRKIKAGRKEKGEMVIVRMTSEEVKRRILESKWKLKGKDVWIEEDLTWEERRIRWNARRVALEREWKGRGREDSVIDYVLGSMKTREKISGMMVEDCVDSDHHPFVVKIARAKGGRGKSEGRNRRMSRWIWTDEGKEEFREAIGELPRMEGEVREVWEEMRRQVKDILEKGNKKRRDRIRRGWWDEECEEKKGKGAKEMEKSGGV
ncbi:golgin subfamily A member 6-like protein 22 [Odontomachus brunneus]|uniref:golgin subfamily A member 6-like protein 22 n=1 Tax=Odontomachus brunneus TaxID=486640 RepID=UPI0013F1C19E|nr:golgin subfamily A member 6-like protein 22 [Odontomachus brunneus]